MFTNLEMKIGIIMVLWDLAGFSFISQKISYLRTCDFTGFTLQSRGQSVKSLDTGVGLNLQSVQVLYPLYLCQKFSYPIQKK